MFANTQMMGIDLGFPDVCLTPTPAGPLPLPYPNIAAGPTALGMVPNVLMGGAPAHNLSSEVPLTNGDNVGVSGGLASGTVMGPARHLTGGFTCLVGGMPVSRLTSVAVQNSTNCPGVRLVPSQLKVLVLSP